VKVFNLMPASTAKPFTMQVPNEAVGVFTAVTFTRDGKTLFAGAGFKGLIGNVQVGGCFVKSKRS
jgi:hypothetical protein